MVDRDILQRKIKFIEQTYNKLQSLQRLSPEDFFDNFQTVDSAKYNLQVAIEAIVDISNHIIARERFGLPDSSAEAIELLKEHGILTLELTQKLRIMVKFRNRIVHLYQEVNDAQIYEILKEDLNDIKNFIHTITSQYLI